MFYRLYVYLNALFGLSFKEENLEKRFQKLQIKDNLSQNFIAVKIAFTAYLVYYVVAYYMTPEDFLFNAFFTLPVPIFLSLIFLFTTDKSIVNKGHLFKLFIFALGIGFPPVLNIALSDLYQQVYVTNTMLALFAVYVMYGAPFVVAFISVSTLLVFFFSMLFFSGLSGGETLYSIFLIVTTFVISTVSGYLIERSKRKNYLAVFKQEELNIQLLEEQRKNLQREKLLQEQTRLAQMGEMISMIAHQWRQPLAAISSSVVSIQIKKASGKFDLELKEDRDQFLDFHDKKLLNINEYVKILTNTIDDFRNFFKPDKEKELVRLTVPIERALQIVESSLNSKNIQLTTTFNCDDAVLMYQNEMMQVVLNIIKNAEDNFIEKKIQNPQVNILCEKQEDNYLICISDNGGGIPEDILPNIFDPYFSTKDEKNGTGLGLYMSKIIVEEHNGGKLDASNKGDGVMFEIILT